MTGPGEDARPWLCRGKRGELGGCGAAPEPSGGGVSRRRFHPGRLMRGLKEESGGVLALVALFLPVAIVATGMVVDLGMVFVARKAVQAACDLGSLAGVLELDWDRLAAGEVRLRGKDAEDMASSVARQNLDATVGLVDVRSLRARVRNPPEAADPVVQVEVQYTVPVHYLGWVPGLQSGFEGTVFSEASVVERTRW